MLGDTRAGFEPERNLARDAALALRPVARTRAERTAVPESCAQLEFGVGARISAAEVEEPRARERARKPRLHSSFQDEPTWHHVTHCIAASATSRQCIFVVNVTLAPPGAR